MESQLSFRIFGQRVQKRLKFFPDHPQHLVVLEQLGVHLRELFEDFSLPGQQFALLDKCTNDMNAHFNRLRAVQNIRRHERTMLGEGVR